MRCAAHTQRHFQSLLLLLAFSFLLRCPPLCPGCYLTAWYQRFFCVKTALRNSQAEVWHSGLQPRPCSWSMPHPWRHRGGWGLQGRALLTGGAAVLGRESSRAAAEGWRSASERAVPLDRSVLWFESREHYLLFNGPQVEQTLQESCIKSILWECSQALWPILARSPKIYNLMSFHRTRRDLHMVARSSEWLWAAGPADRHGKGAAGPRRPSGRRHPRPHRPPWQPLCRAATLRASPGRGREGAGGRGRACVAPPPGPRGAFATGTGGGAAPSSAALLALRPGGRRSFRRDRGPGHGPRPPETPRQPSQLGRRVMILQRLVPIAVTTVAVGKSWKSQDLPRVCHAQICNNPEKPVWDVW